MDKEKKCSTVYSSSKTIVSAPTVLRGNTVPSEVPSDLGLGLDQERKAEIWISYLSLGSQTHMSTVYSKNNSIEGAVPILLERMLYETL